MSRYNASGFTIIEVLLFLAITGMLVAGVLGTTGGVINSQRYKDSVSSLKSILQKQYSGALNTDNERSDDMICDTNGKVSTGASTVSRGQSNCVILGKAIQLSGNNRSELSIKDVIGYPGNSLPSNTLNDLDNFRSYRMQLPATSSGWPIDTYSLEWGSSVSATVNQTGLVDQSNGFTILILRSPMSGVLYTFIDRKTYSDSNIGNMISVANYNSLVSSLDVCVDSNGLVDALRNRMAVRISSDATSATGVETIGDATSRCP